MQAPAQPRKVTVAATQFATSWDLADNLVRARREPGNRERTAGSAAAAAPLLAAAAACHRRRRPAAKALHAPLQNKAERLVRAAAAEGANIILLQVCDGWVSVLAGQLGRGKDVRVGGSLLLQVCDGWVRPV